MSSNATDRTLIERLERAPRAVNPHLAGNRLADVQAKAADLDGSVVLSDPRAHDLLIGLLDGSPYLATLAERDPLRLIRLLQCSPEKHLDSLVEAAGRLALAATSQAEAMAGLRGIKNEAALLIAMADLGGAWPLQQVCRALTRIGDATARAAVRFLFAAARNKGDWTGGSPAEPELGSGYFVLGMGKYGAGELNYSSDIDLIVFYEPDRVALRQGLERQSFFVRLTRDLVKILQERTGDGYVFRVDLRLRPDPGATQIALSTVAALEYYESYGQNWERAAMIKARAVAGDIEAGQAFLAELSPFIWRKYLDFASIADIHAMKRQIHAHRGFGKIAVSGHNIKLGRGGIREIEFFVQTQQLIAGGRQADLRLPTTLGALAKLRERGWITPHVEEELTEAYDFLRTIEHRLQMVADEQTHTLPAEAEALDRFARFAGFASRDELAAALLERLERVQTHYAALFEGSPELTGKGHNLVFAGETDDPATLETLEKLGFSQPSQVIAIVRGWHHGRAAAVRSSRARELLTEVQPLLIEAFAETASPDAAFVSFDRFLTELPSGVQLFSLLKANPNLLRLVADIMGTAPRLATILSRRRRVIDAVLDPRVIGTLPSREEIARLIQSELDASQDIQEALDRARVIGNEQSFLIGVRVLSGMISAPQAGGAYAQLAEELIGGMQSVVESDFTHMHGTVPGGAAAVVAMGKLGGREMTASSDLDLIVIYVCEEGPAGKTAESDGERSIPVTHYYSRLTHRLITALSAPTAEGRLYEVDMRLRPSGQQGPVATRLASFIDYQQTSAWTWEHMALTRARVITGPSGLKEQVEAAIHHALCQRRDRARIAADVRDMRKRIAAEKGTENIWDLKQVRGGLVDVEFMAQYLQLVNAADHPEVLDQNTAGALVKLETAGLLSPQAANVLIPAARLLSDLTQILRLCLDSQFNSTTASQGLKDFLARAADAPSFERLEEHLRVTLSETAALFDEIVA